MNRTKYTILLKSIYYLMPRIIREQYNDSARFYIDLYQKIKNKYIKQNYSYYVLVDEINKLKNNFEILLEIDNRNSTINEIVIYEKNKGLYKIPPITNKVLNVKVGVFDEVTVIGSTDALLYDYKLYHQELLAMEEHHDLKRKDIFIDFNKKDKNIISLNNNNNQILDDENTIYITLLKEHSINYYHWITENIPRFILMLDVLSRNNNLIKDKKITLLVDQGMPNQCKEILDLIIPFSHNIIEIKKGQRSVCKNLIYCSPFWQSLDNTSGILNRAEFFIDKYAIELVLKAIRKNIKLDKKSASRKVYLRRKSSQMRSILNKDAVEKHMKLNGFEIVETAKMSFVEQVKLFHEAKIVVGASGATFTNILFMQPLSKAIIFFPSHPSINHGMFQPLADISNIDFIHYHTLPQDNKSIHSNFMVDLDTIDTLLMEKV